MAGRPMARQGGFTLVELLVATAAGIVVLFALTTIMIDTLHQTQRTGAAIDATRQARAAVARIENELHSACVGGNVAPIQANSTGSDLVFLSFTGTSDTATPVWHDISFTNGTLTDSSYAVNLAVGGGWTQGAKTGSVQLLSSVSALGTNPIFQYFAYHPYLGTDGNYYWTIPDGTNPQPVTGGALGPSALSVPLSTSDAATAVEVVIDMNVGPSDGNASLFGATDPVTDSISLRLTTPPDYSTTAADTTDFAPCQ